MRREKEKKALNGKIRELIYFLERLLFVVFAVSVVLVFMNSFFKIQTSYDTTYHYTVEPFGKEKDYEEREIFHTLLLGKMEQITRFVAIRHIMETQGEYDGKKVIDVADKAEGLEKTVPYALDDLIAWGNYGFEYDTYIGTWQQLESLFQEKTKEEEGKEGGLLKHYSGSLEENRERLAMEGEEGRYAMEVIRPRYLTTQGKDLVTYASSIEEYEVLKEELVSQAKKLSQDYTDYISLLEECSQGKTNLNYCFLIPKEGEHIYYTNSNIDTKGKQADDLTAEIKGESKTFLFFDPDKVQINTSTDISAKQMRNLLRDQEGVFQDSTKVWFWMDDTYEVEDSFQSVKRELEEYKPYQQILLLIMICSLLGIILCIVVLTKTEGRIQEEDGAISYGTKKTDTIPVELWTLFMAMFEGGLLFLMGILLTGYQKGQIGAGILPVLAGTIAFIGNEIASRWYLSVIRRSKAGVFWKTTLLYLAGKKGREFAVTTYENGGIVSRTWIPYLLFLIINLILVLLGIGGVVGAFLLDMLIGILLYNQKKQLQEIVQGIERIRNGDSKYRIDTSKLKGDHYDLAVAVNGIGSGIRLAVESSMKDEKMKTDLITNVSHDIKTPLTSIITYVDLLKRENIKEERILGYLEVLDNKSQRLKQLIDDLVEASKISSGNITLNFEIIDFAQLVKQSLGEFDEKLQEKKLQIVFKDSKEPMYVEADSSQLWRVMENLMANACKYSLPGTRIYVEMDSVEEDGKWKNQFFIKNISENLLEVGAEELMERFMRGDLSRKTEGSGLGLSITKNLIEVMGGEFKIEVDGDLFKAVISFLAVTLEETNL